MANTRKSVAPRNSEIGSSIAEPFGNIGLLQPLKSQSSILLIEYSPTAPILSAEAGMPQHPHARRTTSTGGSPSRSSTTSSESRPSGIRSPGFHDSAANERSPSLSPSTVTSP